MNAVADGALGLPNLRVTRAGLEGESGTWPVRMCEYVVDGPSGLCGDRVVVDLRDDRQPHPLAGDALQADQQLRLLVPLLDRLAERGDALGDAADEGVLVRGHAVVENFRIVHVTRKKLFPERWIGRWIAGLVLLDSLWAKSIGPQHLPSWRSAAIIC